MLSVRSRWPWHVVAAILLQTHAPFHNHAYASTDAVEQLIRTHPHLLQRNPLWLVGYTSKSGEPKQACWLTMAVHVRLWRAAGG